MGKDIRRDREGTNEGKCLLIAIREGRAEFPNDKLCRRAFHRFASDQGIGNIDRRDRLRIHTMKNTRKHPMKACPTILSKKEKR